MEKENLDSGEKTKREVLLDMLDEMIKSYDNLSQGAMMTPVTNYDLQAALMLMQAIFKAEG